jgi:hypothetical protein
MTDLLRVSLVGACADAHRHRRALASLPDHFVIDSSTADQHVDVVALFESGGPASLPESTAQVLSPAVLLQRSSDDMASVSAVAIPELIDPVWRSIGEWTEMSAQPPTLVRTTAVLGADDISGAAFTDLAILMQAAGPFASFVHARVTHEGYDIAARAGNTTLRASGHMARADRIERRLDLFAPDSHTIVHFGDGSDHRPAAAAQRFTVDGVHTSPVQTESTARLFWRTIHEARSAGTAFPVTPERLAQVTRTAQRVLQKG